MDDDLPTEYDVIVIGTGLTEAIVAAASSRVGKTVLHLDTNEYYGGFWASFNVDAFQKQIQLNLPHHPESGKDEGRKNIPVEKLTFLHNATEEWFNFDEKGDVDGWNKEKILQEFRKFNIDITPKLFYSKGAMVELLISSNICRYAEFRACDRVATILKGRIMTVPSSRSDVFTNKDVTVVEKRLLMKFLSNCMEYEKHIEDIEKFKTFSDYLKHQKLTDNLIHYILYSISMGNDKTTPIEGLEGVRKLLRSLGHYGNTPFIFPMYGCGEIPQCFCRLCAVFGGIYCLNKKIDNINFGENDKFESISCGSQTLKANHLVLGQGYVSEQIFDGVASNVFDSKCGNLARGMFLTTVPLGGHSQNTGGGGVTVMKLPPIHTEQRKDVEGVYVLQLAHYSGTCPKDIFLIHITGNSLTDDPKADLKPYVDQLLSTKAPVKREPTNEDEEEEENTTSTILYATYFKIPACIKCEQCKVLSPSKGIQLACGPFFELDYDKSIQQTKDIFKSMFPDDEFLPRAPDPEEIIIGDEDEAKIENALECEESDKDISVEKANECEESCDEKVENAKECEESLEDENGAKVDDEAVDCKEME